MAPRARAYPPPIDSDWGGGVRLPGRVLDLDICHFNMPLVPRVTSKSTLNTPACLLTNNSQRDSRKQTNIPAYKQELT